MIKDQFTVIATCYNDESSITAYFDNLSKQTIQPDEYIVVDGGSRDDTVAVVEKYAQESTMKIRVISGERLNISQGYNRGIRESKTNIVVITGIGNSYEQSYFEELLKCYSQSQAQVCYGVTYGQGNTHFSRKYDCVYVGGKQGIHPMPTNRGMLIEKDAFEKIGYFYEEFVYAGEDVEFYELIRKHNIPVAFTKQAKLYWDTPRTVKEFRKQQRAYFIGSLQIYGVDAKKKAIYRSICFWLTLLLLLVFTVLHLTKPYPYLVMLFAYAYLAIRIKDFSPVSVLIKLYSILSPVVFYIKCHKYADVSYRVKR